MRTNIEIDDHLMREAMLRSGKRTKIATVEAGLRALLEIYGQTGVRKFRGKVNWEGEMAISRAGRISD